MSSLPAPNHSQNLIGHCIDDGKLQFVSVLGLGAYGVVYLAKDISPTGITGAKGPCSSGHYAVKCLNKVGMDGRQRSFQRREIALHGLASSHPNIATLHNVIETSTCIYVVLSYYADGDLFGMITERGRYLANDDLIRSVFVQIIDAVEFCHKLGIYHRDLKPENILCSDDGHDVALADFGLATAEKTSGDFGCGSTFYMSPECQGGLFQRLGSYSTLHNDIWSLGVILVNLTCGRNPWKQASPSDETFRAYLQNPDFLRSILPVSNPCNSLLKRIFCLNPIQRISLAELRAEVVAMKRWTMTEEELRHATRATREAARAFAPAPPSPVTSTVESAPSWGAGVQASEDDVARYRAERWANGKDGPSSSFTSSSSTSDFSYASSASNWTDFDPRVRSRKSTKHTSTPPRPIHRAATPVKVAPPRAQQPLPPTPPQTPRRRPASAHSERPRSARSEVSDEPSCFSASSSVSGISIYDDAEAGVDAMVIDTPPPARSALPAVLQTPPTPPTPSTPRLAINAAARLPRKRGTTSHVDNSPLPAFGSSPSSSSSSGSSTSSSAWSAMPPTPETPNFPTSSARREPAVIVVSPTPSRVSLAQTSSLTSNASSKASYASYYGRYAEWAEGGGDCDMLDTPVDDGAMTVDCPTTPCQQTPSQSALFSSRLAAHLAREQEKLRCIPQSNRVRAC